MFNWFENGLNWLFHKYFYLWYNLQESGVSLPGKELKEFRINAYSQQMAEGATATLTMSLVPIFFTAIIGIPLGVFLAAADQKGNHYIFKENNATIGVVRRILDLMVNLGRAIPAIILIVLLMGVSRFVFNTAIGAKAMIIPLSLAAIPFGARIVETAIRGVDPGILEAAQSMGATPLQIITKFYLPEAKPAIISGLTLTYVSLVGYTAIAGVIGGGGWGDFAVTVGHGYRETSGLILAAGLLTLLVIIGQLIGDFFARRADKRKL
ncbi:MAG: methionine ABC transporter permease [Alphaproteobacteria bacterium]